MLEVTGYLLGMPLHPSTRISCESWETRLQRVASDSLSYSGPGIWVGGFLILFNSSAQLNTAADFMPLLFFGGPPFNLR